ncbi:aminopeptidase P family protein [Pedobacter psychroterrae]|uniref:Xaa-Pro aminopeptidase n=1 Tax=Pedobacter psychroterrae TaxID=2530453 RepID=A0A4R0NNM0_9SPHI|nr:aminopeptidase P family protein [Pedobacter psychroterrae]TCD01568.1 M24 family metallopeptidase [Pedobacter psychroterrae]
MFNSTVYVQRRAVLRKKFHTGILLFMGNGESPMNYAHNPYHFRQDSSFLYYFGVNDPDLIAIVDLDEDRDMVFGAEMSIDDLVWMGRQESLQGKCAKAGITQLALPEKLVGYLRQAKLKGREIHFLPPYRAENKITLSRLLDLNVHQVADFFSTDLVRAVAAQRSVKAVEEIAELDKAASISADIQLMVMQSTKPGMYEREIAAEIHAAALRSGGNLAYPVILTVNGEILHNYYRGNILEEGKLVLNDSGVETAMGYAGDLTRTFPVSKTFTADQKEVYDIVLNAYRHASSMLTPGVRYLDIHLESCKQLVLGLKDMGLMKGDAEDAVAAGAHTLFFQCGTGHMMGLDVHDMEDLGEQYVGYTDTLKKNTTKFGLKSLRMGKALEAGYVMTVEPGIYFNKELLDRYHLAGSFSEFINYEAVEKFRDFGGIRIEDDFLVLETGARMLGKHLAITTAEIEQIRADSY